ncbi:MAG: 7TM diverse intracellular signaling domain-containing protein, partial [Spirochaetota bacterium]
GRAFRIIEVYLLATVFLPIVLSYDLIIRLMMVSSFLGCILVLLAGGISLKRNRKPAALYLSAWIVFLAGGILYALKVAGAVPSGFITNYAMQCGSAIQFVILSFGLGIRINIMRMDKEKAQQQEYLLQKRYSIIAENTDDLIFSLDEKLMFLTMNRSVRRFIPACGDLSALNFRDLLHADDDNDGSFTRQMILDQIEKAKGAMTPFTFKAEFTSPHSFEPVEMNIRFEFITILGRNEIVGRAWRAHEDVILQYFRAEKQEYSIGNLLPAAEEISHRLTRNLVKYVDQKESNLVRIGIREILLNAIEHGNLSITYEEKTEALVNDSYFRLIEKRRTDPEHSDKTVHVVYSVTPARAIYRITDMGNGFDHRNLDKKTDEANEQMLGHGRGVMMAKNVFDKIAYNDKGNSVTLVKYFGKPVSSAS